MAGSIKAQERTAVVLTSSGASMTNSTALAATTNLDARAAGNAPDDYSCRLELVAQWATITNITAGMVVAELYLVPAIDGTNFADVDATAGASRLPFATLAAVFEVPKVPTAATNMRLVSSRVDLDPLLHKPYVKNISGQTISAAWTLTVVSVQDQYT